MSILTNRYYKNIKTGNDYFVVQINILCAINVELNRPMVLYKDTKGIYYSRFEDEFENKFELQDTTESVIEPFVFTK